MEPKAKYKNWRGLNIFLAEEIEKKLFKKIEHKPTKRDFIRHGEYSAWMALYRYRKRTAKGNNEISSITNNLEGEYISKLRPMIKNPDNSCLIGLLFRDLVDVLGTEKARVIWTDIDAEAAENLEHKIYSQKRQDSLKRSLYYIIQKLGAER